MKVILNVSQLWPKNGDKDVTIETAAKELDMNPRSLTTIKKGTERGNWDTLIKLKYWLSYWHGREISLEELLKVETEQSDREKLFWLEAEEVEG